MAIDINDSNMSGSTNGHSLKTGPAPARQQYESMAFDVCCAANLRNDSVSGPLFWVDEGSVTDLLSTMHSITDDHIHQSLILREGKQQRGEGSSKYQETLRSLSHPNVENEHVGPVHVWCTENSFECAIGEAEEDCNNSLTGQYKRDFTPLSLMDGVKEDEFDENFSYNEMPSLCDTLSDDEDDNSYTEGRVNDFKSRVAQSEMKKNLSFPTEITKSFSFYEGLDDPIRGNPVTNTREVQTCLSDSVAQVEDRQEEDIFSVIARNEQLLQFIESINNQQVGELDIHSATSLHANFVEQDGARTVPIDVLINSTQFDDAFQ